MKNILICILTQLMLFSSIKAQEKPKLVVGIVVDQMRYDYMYRFWDKFSDDGFKKLINEGHFFRNTQFGYVPTFTGPGHASIFTGTTPSVHGIIANNWYDKNAKKEVYCAGDGDMHTICNCEKSTTDVLSTDGKMSPKHMLTTTIGDELQLFNPSSKVIGISLKDRGAILSAGHSADAAYWMDKHGEWITSSFYMENLPDWLIRHQNKKSTSNYLNGYWKRGNDFSHDLDALFEKEGGGAIKGTPLGNTILKDLGVEIIKQEKLGKDDNTDFLSISFSSTDYIGHQYGPHSSEITDTYIRLDKDIALLLKVIENHVGKENTLIFLTADHGVVSEPNKLMEQRIPAGYYSNQNVTSEMASHLRDVLNWPSDITQAKDYILKYSNNQLFLNHDFINKNLSVNVRDIQKICADYLLNYEWVKNTFTAEQMNNYEYRNGIASLIQRGYNQKRSGDVIVVPHTGWISSYYESGGTTHGSAYSYDTHIPLVFWGGNIKKGKTDRRVNIRDIAPTISTILGISFPNGCTGNPMPEITE